MTEARRRRVYLVMHGSRSDTVLAIGAALTRALRTHGVEVVGESAQSGAQGCELVVVLGGDGTILRAAEQARAHDIPLLGVNLGHVGFLAEAEPEALPEIVRHIVDSSYSVEERMTLDVGVRTADGEVTSDWALNEAAIGKGASAGMVDASVSVDGRGLSSFGCDGVVLATPTGSTAYAFSAGGPVVWPDVQAMLFVPIAAHALFSRPLVVGPSSVLAVRLGMRADEEAEVWCDGRRRIAAPHGTVVEVRVHTKPLRLARINMAPFSSRLVAKFHLPVTGWRDRGSGSA